MLKGVTIAAGGVLPNIHPELLAKKRGARGKLETPVAPAPEKRPVAAKKPAAKKGGGKKAGGKAKVWRPTNGPGLRSDGGYQRCIYLWSAVRMKSRNNMNARFVFVWLTSTRNQAGVNVSAC